MSTDLEYILKYAAGMVVIIGAFLLQAYGKLGTGVCATIIGTALTKIAHSEWKRTKSLESGKENKD